MTRYPTRAEIAAEDQAMLDRQRRYRDAADRMARLLARQAGVEKIALIGSAGRPLWREVSPYPPFHRSGIRTAHRCKDVDLAVWVSRLDGLDRLRRDRVEVTRPRPSDRGGIPVQEIELFLLEPETDRYLGRVCYFRQCPADKPACVVAGCGAQPYLRQHEDFTFWPETLDPSRMTVLFDRGTGGIIGTAAALPSLIDDAPGMIEVTVTIPEHRRGELEELVGRWKRDD